MIDKIKCKKCGLDKTISEFYLKSFSSCKECKKIYQSKYYESNKIEIEKYKKEYYENNKDKIIEKQLQNQKNNKEKIANYQKEYRKNNKDKIKNHSKNKRFKIKNTPFLKLRMLVSNAIFYGLKFNGKEKGITCTKYLNYSFNELKNHLESLFEPWMNWNNHGIYDPKIWDDKNQNTWTWQIDHIIPQSKLPYSSMEDENFKKCWALENLRPYSAKQNILDGNKR